MSIVMHGRWAALVALLCGALGCEGPPTGPLAGAVELEVEQVLDPSVYEATQVFQIHVLQGTSSSGEALSCAAMPGTYREDSPNVVRLVNPPPAMGKPAAAAQTVPMKVQVPADQSLVFVVLGLAIYKGSTHVVGRGCKDNLRFKQGAKESVAVDLKATAGAPCARTEDCERNLTCVQGAGFEKGSCTVSGCAAGQACPPGAACVLETTYNGLCLRKCTSLSDCPAVDHPYTQDCIGRKGIGGAGCSAICGQPKWNVASCCNAGPSQCTADGGRY